MEHHTPETPTKIDNIPILPKVELVRMRKDAQKFSTPRDIAHPQIDGLDPSVATFEFEQEGHTLGNALRYMLMRK